MQKIFGSIGRAVSSTSRTRNYVTGQGLSAAAKQARQIKYGIAEKGASSKDATIAFEKAITKRQEQIGRRVTLGVGGVGFTSMITSPGQNRGAYNPMPAPKGTGRYA